MTSHVFFFTWAFYYWIMLLEVGAFWQRGMTRAAPVWVFFFFFFKLSYHVSTHVLPTFGLVIEDATVTRLFIIWYPFTKLKFESSTCQFRLKKITNSLHSISSPSLDFFGLWSRLTWVYPIISINKKRVRK